MCRSFSTQPQALRQLSTTEHTVADQNAEECQAWNHEFHLEGEREPCVQSERLDGRSTSKLLLPRRLQSSLYPYQKVQSLVMPVSNFYLTFFTLLVI